MKSVVLDIKKGYAAVLSDDGRVTKVKNNDYMIGQVIEMKIPNISKISTIKKFAVCAASIAVLTLGGGVGVWAYTTPYSYVSLDVNPSIEYTVNRFDIVIGVTAVNDDGESIIDQINLSNLTNSNIKSAIEDTVDQIAKDGYFDGSTSTAITSVTGSAITMNGSTDATVNLDISLDGGIVISTSSEDAERSEKLADALKETVEATLLKSGDDVDVEVINVGLDRVERARALGVTPGKLNLVEKLQASAKSSDTIVLEEWLDKPVKDIMKAIKENRKNESDVVLTNNSIEDANTIDSEEEITLTTEEKDTEKAKIDADKVAEKAKKEAAKTLAAKERAIEKVKKDAALAADKTKREADKALTAEEKATEKAKKNAELAADKAKKEADKTLSAEEKATEKEVKDAELAAEKIQKQADKTLAAEEKAAEKANSDAELAADKAKRDTDLTAEKAKRDVELDADKAKREAELADKKTKN